MVVIGDRIVRVDISKERVTTIRGVKKGDTEDKILKLYPGDIQVVTGLIGGGMKRFTFVPKDAADKKYRLIFQYFGQFFTTSVSLSRASPRIFNFFSGVNTKFKL